VVLRLQQTILEVTGAIRYLQPSLLLAAEAVALIWGRQPVMVKVVVLEAVVPAVLLVERETHRLQRPHKGTMAATGLLVKLAAVAAELVLLGKLLAQIMAATVVMEPLLH
jgi:hypothetical protein